MSRWLLVAILLAVGIWLNTRDNQFPYYYHPDEHKKVEQVLTNERNFNHPLLLLSVAEVAWKGLASPKNPQQVVEIGRCISAVFCTLGTIFFALAAWSWRGPIAGVVTGVLLTGNHQVFELAHYMKEDPALYLGVGLTAWMLIVYEQMPSRKLALLLGGAVGLALSGKYLGLIMLAPALALILSVKENRKNSRIAFLLIGMITVFLVFNFRLFLEIGTFLQSFSKEMDWAVRGQKELTRSVPHSIYLNIFVSSSTPLIWILLGAFAIEIWRNNSVISSAAWCLIATIVGWFILLSFSPKTNDRYFLPLAGLCYLFAGIGADYLWRKTREQTLARVGLVGMILGAAIWDGSRTYQFSEAFAHDDRAELTAWIIKNIPVTATIAYDSRVNLPDEEVHHELQHPLPHRLLRETFVADIAGPIERIENKIDYVVISESSYGRFFLDSLRPKQGELQEYESRADFYRQLKLRAPLWKRERGNVLYLHPGLEVYEMAH